MAQDVEIDIPLGSGGTQMCSDSVGRRVCRRRRKDARGGFSLIELLVVVMIMLILAAIAIPNIMQTINDVRLRSAANSVAGLLQEGRLRAVRDNTYYAVVADSNTADSQIACLDLNKNGTCVAASTTDNLDPQVRLGGVNVLTTSAPPFSVKSKAGLSSSNNDVIEQDKNLNVYFNSRGLPCVVSGSLCKNTGASGKGYAYIYYITDQRPIFGWAAITVSAAGRVRVWMYRGNNVWE